jgi:hypothetical protein
MRGARACARCLCLCGFLSNLPCFLVIFPPVSGKKERVLGYFPLGKRLIAFNEG